MTHCIFVQRQTLGTVTSSSRQDGTCSTRTEERVRGAVRSRQEFKFSESDFEGSTEANLFQTPRVTNKPNLYLVTEVFKFCGPLVQHHQFFPTHPALPPRCGQLLVYLGLCLVTVEGERGWRCKGVQRGWGDGHTERHMIRVHTHTHKCTHIGHQANC